MRGGGSGGGLPHAGEVRLGLPRPTGCAAREQASARALYVRMMCDRRLWPVWAIDAVRRAASAARSLAAGRLCIRLYWVCGCIKFFTISYRADLSRPLHDDTRFTNTSRLGSRCEIMADFSMTFMETMKCLFSSCRNHDV